MIKTISFSPLDKEYLSNRREKQGNNATRVDFTKMIVNKPWGYEYLVYNNPFVEVWSLYIKKFASTSTHCHPNKKTGLVLLEGEAMFKTLNQDMKLCQLDGIILEPGVFHSTQAISEEGIHLLEIETPPDKYDLVRLEDKYGREKRGYEGLDDMIPNESRCVRFFNFADKGLVEKDYYSKKICIQSVNSASDREVLRNADLIMILRAENGLGFSAGDVLRNKDFFDNTANFNNETGEGITVMFVKNIS